MKGKTSSSSAESCLEDYSWAKESKFSFEEKKDFLKYPLKEWKEIAYDKDSYLTDEDIDYQADVAKILEQDLFKDYEFYKEKNGKMDFEFNKVYEKPFQSINKNFIAPDFFVYKVPTKKFFDLLKCRNYMLTYKYKIPDNQQFISILGEIKSMPKSAYKSIVQRKAYINFVQDVNNLKTNEFMVLLYIYDHSFCLFKNEINYNAKISEEHLPIIYGYIPKLYYEDRNEVNNIEIISLENEKELLENEIESLQKENELLQKKNKLLKGLIVMIAIFISITEIFDWVLSKRPKKL